MQTTQTTNELTEDRTHRTIIPGATYRIQFNQHFTFRDGLAIIPYLKELGITHVYASPFFRARPGSMHGYDIIDHTVLNSEIGTPEDFNEFAATLRTAGMGLIVDFVPNHMGIGSDNPWWLDVLENGPASAYANYFDIDWDPVKKELFGKVLIPVLGESYGNILASGQLKLSFDCETGKISIDYYEHHLPLNPVSYPTVLGSRLDELKERLGTNNADWFEYLSILSAFERLPNHIEPEGFAERIGEKLIQTRRLSALCHRSKVIREFVESCISQFNVIDEDAGSMHRMHQLLEAQPYRLAYWRVASDEINYRRFFDINDLAAIRTEDARVFNDIHRLIFDLVAERLIEGIRIDHPDGLFDPETYFRRLQQVCAERLDIDFKPQSTAGGALHRSLPIYVVAEKILAPFEQLEDSWLVQGTTGYEFMDTLNNLLVAEGNEQQFNAIYEDFVGYKPNFDAMRRECKEVILDTVLASELNVLAHRLSRIAETSSYFRDFTLTSLRNAIRNIVVHFPVYRTYTSGSGVPESAKQYIDWAVKLAKRNSAVPWPVYDFVAGVLKGDLDPEMFGLREAEEVFAIREKLTHFAMQFQQFTGPVTAKSVEDTLFYRYVRLVCLNEVGGEPKRFGTSAAAFHRQNIMRQEKRPYGMLSTSTHDTKRSEDVRARIAVLSEVPDLWRETVFRWSELNRDHKPSVDDERIPHPNEEYLLYQNIFGAFPFDAGDEATLAQFRERIQQYAMKATKESKLHTSWIVPNEPYEQAMNEFVGRILTPNNDNQFLADVRRFATQLAPFGFMNALTQTTLKLTSPGVPDFYQGNEIWDFSLVDPDNRRPVDFALRANMLKKLNERRSDAVDETSTGPGKLADLCRLRDGSIKLFVVASLLRYRKLYPELFTQGEYMPLETSGSAAAHVLAFARRNESDSMIVAVPLKLAALMTEKLSDSFAKLDPDQFLSTLQGADLWGDTTITIPESFPATELTNLFTGQCPAIVDKSIAAASLFSQFPISVLVANGI